jgi:hypothetical protein
MCEGVFVGAGKAAGSNLRPMLLGCVLFYLVSVWLRSAPSFYFFSW